MWRRTAARTRPCAGTLRSQKRPAREWDEVSIARESHATPATAAAVRVRGRPSQKGVRRIRKGATTPRGAEAARQRLTVWRRRHPGPAQAQAQRNNLIPEKEEATDSSFKKKSRPPPPTDQKRHGPLADAVGTRSPPPLPAQMQVCDPARAAPWRRRVSARPLPLRASRRVPAPLPPSAAPRRCHHPPASTAARCHTHPRKEHRRQRWHPY